MGRIAEGLRADDAKDAVRVIAGVLVAIGLLLVAIRRGSPEIFGEDLGATGLFLVLAAATAFLYGFGVLSSRLGGTPRRWQAFYTVAGALFLPLALFQFAAAVDPTYDESLAAFFIFSICAAASVGTWMLAAVRYQLLLASLYAGFAWLALLDKAITEPDFDTTRGLLLLFAGAIVGAAVVLRRRAVVEADAAFGDMLTGAGLIALLALALAPLGSLVGRTASAVAIPFSDSPEPAQTMIQQSAARDVITLVIGIALVLYGLGRGLRGQVYVGVLTLSLFTFSVGLDLDDATPEGSIVGWPLLLCLLGAGLFVLSLGSRGGLGPASILGGWFAGEGEAHAGQSSGASVGPAPTSPPAPSQGPSSG